MITRIVIALLVAVLSIGPGILWWESRQTIALLEEQKSQAADELARERAWSASRENVIGALLKIGEDVKKVQDQIQDQEKANRKAMKELMANDKEVRDYMALSIPPALGMRYKRSATTDPTKYGPSGEVPVDPLSVPRAERANP